VHEYSALIIAAVGAWLYFMGWAYLYSYFNFFDTNLIEIEPSIQFVLMHALSPWWFWISKITSGVIILIVAACMIIAVLLRYTRLHAHAKSVCCQPLSWVLLVGVAIPLSLIASTSAGKHHASDTWANPGMIARFKFLPEKGNGGNSRAELRDLSDHLKLKYLMSTSRVHYVFVRGPNCKSPHCGLIIKVPTSAVEDLTIITEYVRED
jgi:hypothetical protein